MPQRVTSIYFALLLTVFLLAFPLEGGYTVITEFKYGLFLAICGGYVLTITALRISYAATGTTPVGDIRKKLKSISPAAKFMLGFLFFTALSAVFSAYPGTLRGAFRREGVLTTGIYVLGSFLLSVYFRPQKWMLPLLGAVILPAGAIALVQLTGANPFTLYPQGYNFYGSGIYYTGEFLSTVGNTAFFAAFLSLACGVLAMAVIKLEVRGRWFLALPLFISLLLIFKIGVDAAVVAVLAGLALMLPVAVTSRKTLANTLGVFAAVVAALALSRMLGFADGTVRLSVALVHIIFAATAGFTALLAVLATKLDIFAKITARQYRVASTTAVLGGICLALIYLWQYSGESGGMVYEASQILRGRWHDDFGTRRVFIWRNILERVSWRNLLLGTGPDTLGYWDIPYFYRVDDAGRTFITNIDAAHNELLHIFATTGILSLLAYAGAVIAALVNWYRFPENVLSAIAGAGVLFYVIQALFGISQFISAPFFWACFGVLAAGCIHSTKVDTVHQKRV